MPMPHPARPPRADPRVHLPMRRRRSWSCSSTPASPAGGAGTARPRPSEPEPEVIFVVLSVRSRRAVGTHVSPAMWQPIFFTNDGAALHLCLPVLACERACLPLAALHVDLRLRLPARCVCRAPLLMLDGLTPPPLPAPSCPSLSLCSPPLARLLSSLLLPRPVGPRPHEGAD